MTVEPCANCGVPPTRVPLTTLNGRKYSVRCPTCRRETFAHRLVSQAIRVWNASQKAERDRLAALRDQ